MASREETALASSQEMLLSQGTVLMSSQQMASASQEFISQGSVSQDTSSMLSQDSTTDATILDATGRILMEDETCLEGPTLKCTPEEEWALLNLLFNESINQLVDIPLGYLSVLAMHINQIRKAKALQAPLALTRAPPGLVPPALGTGQYVPPLTSVAGTPVPLSEAIYTASSNLGTTVPCQMKRMPMCPPDQVKMDQAVWVLECLTKLQVRGQTT